jgi:hypothetical protein
MGLPRPYSVVRWPSKGQRVARVGHIARCIRQPLRSRDTCGFFRHSLAIWRQVVWPRRPANPQRMPGASIASISLYVCHPRPVNAYRYATNQRLGLDAERSWVMLTEANRFVWPGPDLRMKEPSGGDTTALVWDATGRMRGGRFETAALSPKELRDSWAALAGDDAADAYRAIWALTASPGQTLPLLKEHLRPLPAADAKETARRLADLDSDDFAVREKAEKELGEQGDLVEPALRKTLDERPSSEVRQRVERLLQNLTSPRGLQRFRALEVLERIGTSEAEKVLKEAARGAPEARLTREAKASLERLSRRPAP